MVSKANSIRRNYGEGSIFEDKKGRWIAALDVGIDLNGKRKRSRRVCKTKREALSALREMQSKKLDKRLQSNEKLTLNALYKEWESYGINQGVREGTRYDYISLAKNYLLPALGSKRIVDISTVIIDQWLMSMKDQGYSAVTRKKSRQVASMIFKFALKKRFIQYNPIPDSSIPRNEIGYRTQVREPLTKNEWKEYLEVFRSTDLDTFLHVGALLGLRRGEIIGLNWADIDFENCYLHVRNSAREITFKRKDGSSKTELILNDPKTKHSKRKLPLEPVLVDALHRQQLRQKKSKLAAGESWQETGAVFTSSVGTRLYPSNVYKQYKKIISVANLRYVRIHDLRHSVATLLLDDEIPLESVSRLLGHSSLSITMDIYAQSLQSVPDRGAKGMADLYKTSAVNKKMRIQNG
jgi:integrase